MLHLQRFYHTRGHYPGHNLSFDDCLVAAALGRPRNLVVSPTNRLDRALTRPFNDQIRCLARHKSYLTAKTKQTRAVLTTARICLSTHSLPLPTFATTMDLTRKREILGSLAPDPCLPPPTPKRPKGQKAVNRVNKRGGASNVDWFNLVLDNPKLDEVVKHLGSKLNKAVKTGFAPFLSHLLPDSFSSDCINWNGSDRIVPDKEVKKKAMNEINCLPAMSHYQLALLLDGRRRPSYDPPTLPEKYRKSIGNTTSKKAKQEDQVATWVVSHLCHNKK